LKPRRSAKPLAKLVKTLAPQLRRELVENQEEFALKKRLDPHITASGKDTIYKIRGRLDVAPDQVPVPTERALIDRLRNRVPPGYLYG
jgi:hypothetical protein